MIKTNISLPDSIFEEAGFLAEYSGLSFSEFHTKALQSYLRKYNRSSVLNQLNQIYSEQSSELETELAKNPNDKKVIWDGTKQVADSDLVMALQKEFGFEGTGVVNDKNFNQFMTTLKRQKCQPTGSAEGTTEAMFDVKGWKIDIGQPC